VTDENEEDDAGVAVRPELETELAVPVADLVLLFGALLEETLLPLNDVNAVPVDKSGSELDDEAEDMAEEDDLTIIEDKEPVSDLG